MATWQYDLLFIPQLKVQEVFSGIPTHLESEALASIEWWKDNQPSPGYEAVISSFLPECSSWSEHIKAWGSEDEDYLFVVFEAEEIVEMGVRVDVRTLSSSFLEGVGRFAVFCNCLCLGEELELFEPTVKALTAKIQESDALSFVNDPARYFENLRRCN